MLQSIFATEPVSDPWTQHRIRLGLSMESPRRPVREATFARFDIQSSLKLPIILWADLVKDANSEVGFSTTAELPTPALEFLQRTCFVEISDGELEEIRGHVLDQVFVAAER